MLKTEKNREKEIKVITEEKEPKIRLIISPSRISPTGHLHLFRSLHRYSTKLPPPAGERIRTRKNKKSFNAHIHNPIIRVHHALQTHPFRRTEQRTVWSTTVAASAITSYRLQCAPDLHRAVPT